MASPLLFDSPVQFDWALYFDGAWIPDALEGDFALTGAWVGEPLAGSIGAKDLALSAAAGRDTTAKLASDTEPRLIVNVR